MPLSTNSDHMKEIGDTYRALITPFLKPQRPRVTFISSVTGEALSEAQDFNAKYWQSNLESPVLFRQATRRLLQESTAASVHLEVGPHSALAGPLKQIYDEQGLQVSYTSVLRRASNDSNALLAAVGHLHCSGIRVRLPVPDDDDAARPLTDLPPYPWDLSRTYWTHSRGLKEWQAPQAPSHELLGQRVRHVSNATPQWRCALSLESVPWIADHRIRNHTMFPAAAYIAMAGEVVHQLTARAGVERVGFVLRDLHIQTALVMRPGESIEVVTEARSESETGLDSAWCEISIRSFQPAEAGVTDSDGIWIKHCTCRARATDSQKQSVSVSRSRNGFLDGVEKACLRQVDAATWYKAMARVGYNYGPRFRGAQEMRTSAKWQAAHIRVAVEESSPDLSNRYAVHPIAIDHVLQATIVASHGGQTRLLEKMWLPVRIDEVFMSQEHIGGFQIDVRATGPGFGDAVCRPDSYEGVNAAQEPISYFRGIRLSAIDNPGNVEPGGAIELVWKPDIDLINPSALVQRTAPKQFQEIQILLQELLNVCVLDLRETLPSCTTLGIGPSTADSNQHLAKQYDWLMSYHPDQATISGMRLGQAASRIKKLARQLEGTPAAAAGHLIQNCHTYARGLFSGEVSPLDLFLQDDALHHLYDWMNSLWSYRGLLQLLSHKLGRNLKILEIGAGTGGLTARVLQDLQEEEDRETSETRNSTIAEEKAMFGTYVFTDVSAGFFPAAKQRFAAVVPPQVMEYRVLDISRSPQEQGFGIGDYDVVIASNVLHATPRLTQTLRHVRTLLRPGGRLLLQELACGAESKWINFIMGFLPGWWLGQADARADEPYSAPEVWRSRLKDAGFDSPELVAMDCDAPLQLNATMIARPSAVATDAVVEVEAETVALCPSVTLLVASECEGVVEGLPAAVQRLEEQLLYQGYKVSRQSMDQPITHLTIPASQRHVVVSAVDLCLQDGWFHDLTERKLAILKRLVDHLQDHNASMLWLTQSCQIRSSNPSFSQCLGVARTIRAELGLRFATLELDFVGGGESDGNTAGGLDQVSQAIHSFIQNAHISERYTNDGLLDQDMEMAYCSMSQAIMIPRTRPISIRSAIHGSFTNSDSGCEAITALRAGRLGSLESLEWTLVPQTKYGSPTTPELPPGAVCVSIQASGLNFKDVMVAMGLLGVPGSEDSQEQGIPLGCEAAGVVTAVGAKGSSQQCLEVGDRVALFAPQIGCFSTEVQVDSRLCARIPDSLSANEAAGLPCVFTTVLRGFDKAGLGPGHTILIHSAAGGVGLAALQVAQYLGTKLADVYATAGSGEKRSFLVEKYGLAPSNIFNSRDDSFVDGVMAATGGRGVDVVLNSLSGDLLHASWGCVAAGGTLVELGKRDVIARARLAMAPFDDNRSFVAVDMARLAVQDPSLVGCLLERTFDLYRQGAIAPVQPLRVFGWPEVEEAFRQLSKSSHVGKVVVDMSHCAASTPKARESGVSLPASLPSPAPVLDPEAVYLLIGGLGGLGSSVSRWMASHGAKSLAIFSRSGAESDVAKDVLAELLEMGCEVTALACDVTHERAFREAISSVSLNTQRRIAGVLFLPMVLADAALSDMTIENWRAATDPKVRGSWNIHHALPRSSCLDFFVLFGSTSGFCGYPGQANYAAANSFLDAFAQYRRGLGLPCSVIDLGPVEDVGHVSNVEEIQKTMMRSGARFVSERQMLQAVQLAMLRSIVPPSQEPGSATDRGVVVQGQLGVGFDVEVPLEDARNSVVWKTDPRMTTLRPGSRCVTAEPSPSPHGLADVISHLRSSPTDLDNPSILTSIARGIASRIFGLLSRDLDQTDEVLLASVSLASLGIDSLITIEVRNWWKCTFSSQITTSQLMNASNFLQLAELGIGQLREANRR